ncbi:MAG TPA: double-strand break repair protein AddB, partial [Kiloniellales bacterium]|nr:double-strand break repair protein AddB [Kiloniellales bacterium]
MSGRAPGGPGGAGKVPCVYNIPPGVSFVDALATGLLGRFGADPLALSRVTLLLPTRRACRALQDAFLRASGGQALLLPRLQALGDIDAEELLLGAEPETWNAGSAELPPAMPPLERQLLLGRLIRHWGRVRGQAPGEDQAVRLAAELARLLDQVETEGLDLAGLETLVPEAYAEHWQITLRFLRILMEQWPAVQAERGRIGPAERRRRLLEAQAEAWRRSPPSDPVIAAGSTGSIPATAALLAVVAGLPAGEVVLPGLDRDSDEPSWGAIERDPCHPQHGLARLLRGLGVAREAVEDWPGCTVPETDGLRARVAAAALAPAEAEPGLRAFAGRADEAALKAALGPVERIDCPGPGEEARVIALVLRRALEEPHARAALVTPDRGLARRVAAELGRWGVSIDDSAGMPLADTPPVTFLRLIADLAAADLAPLALLAVVAGLPAGEVVLPGLDRDSDEATWEAIERDPCHPQHGLARLLRGLGVAREAVEDWLGCTVPETDGLRARVAAAALAPAEAEPGLRAFAGRADEAA